MVVWALIAAALAIYCITIVVRPRPSVGEEKPPRKSLLDFSANQEEARQVRKLLEQALAGAETDADFERNYKRLTGAATGQEAEFGWAWLSRWLMDYRKAGEFGASPLVLARRYLDDLPRRYGLKDRVDKK